MRIALNCIFFQPQGGGISEYIYNLLNNIALLDDVNEYIIYVLKDQESFGKQNLPSKFKIKTIPYGSSFFDTIMRSMFAQKFWEKEEVIERFDLFHSPFFHCPKFKYAKTIITVHDMRFYRFPSTYTLLRYVYLKYKVKSSVRIADRVITISKFTKDELVDAYRIPEDKVTVIYEAINKDRFSLSSSETGLINKYNLHKNEYLLTVGQIEPRKNYERLIKSFEIIKKEKKFCNLKLVIVGRKGHGYSKVLNMCGRIPDVLYLDFVDHNTLVDLYNNANLFVFPSYYEGFGFPPLEAGSLGVVSAVSNVSSMPEVCGDSVAYFDPFNVDSMASIISDCILNDGLREKLRNRMKNQLNKFSWIENAKQTLEIYKNL